MSHVRLSDVIKGLIVTDTESECLWWTTYLASIVRSCDVTSTRL